MNDIRDIKGPVAVPEPEAVWPLWAGAGLLALAGLALWRWRRARRAATRPAGATLAALADLAPDGGDLADRDYAFRLAAVVRELLESRCGFAATAMTVAEIAARLDRAPLPRPQAEALVALLHRAERASFAAKPLSRSDRAGDWRTAADLAAGGRP